MEVPADGTAGRIAIDEGFRRWYAACPCCLGENYPDVKAELERDGAGGDIGDDAVGEHAPVN